MSSLCSVCSNCARLCVCLCVCVVQICMEICQTLAAEIRSHWLMGFQWMLPCKQWKLWSLCFQQKNHSASSVGSHCFDVCVFIQQSMKHLHEEQLGWEFWTFCLFKCSDNQARSREWGGSTHQLYLLVNVHKCQTDIFNHCNASLVP